MLPGTTKNLHAWCVRWSSFTCLAFALGCQNPSTDDGTSPFPAVMDPTAPTDSAPLGPSESGSTSAQPTSEQAPGTSSSAPEVTPGTVTPPTESGPGQHPVADPSDTTPTEIPVSPTAVPTASSAPSAEPTEPAATTPAIPDPSSPEPAQPPRTDPIVLDVDQVWSGHPVPFALVTHGDWQFVAYYAANQQMVVASRQLEEETWQTQMLPTSIGWDSHNYIAMATDSEGYVHVSGNMHNVPLIYFRTTQPLDVSSFERVPSMVGSNEQSCTYPEFFEGPSGNLVFAYRDGGSGNGDHIFNSYDVNTKQWKRLLDTPLTDGEGQRNAYPVGPIQGPQGYWHLVWVWRDTPDASTNHDISYTRTMDLVQWEQGNGSPQQLPIRIGTGDIVDPVPSGGGMINNNTKVGFDQDARPIVSYHKYDAGGNTQLYNARLENNQWVVHQTSNWDYRWDFGGNGTLVFEIELEGPQPQADGSLTQTYYHAQYGGWGAFRLDPVTLEAVEQIDPPLPYPSELDAVESNTAGMRARWVEDWSADESSGYRYLLRWESLDSNRDMPRDPVPPPTQLRLYGFPTETE